MREREILLKLCIKGLQEKGLADDDKYKERLKKEIKGIDALGEHEYLLRTYQKFKNEKLQFPHNEHNNLVDLLLNLAPDFDIEKEGAWSQGEWPDIDIDYIRPVRDYLKRDWAARTFGQENICEIATYGRAGIKSSALDMARTHGIGHHELQSITTELEDKDDEGEPLEWDKIFELAERDNSKQQDTVYTKFAAWCDANKDVASAAKMMLGRNKNGGVHAGGLVISNQRLDGFVPLEVRSVNKDKPEGVICAAWGEGLHTQDLQPVGLIKFDLLVINNLMQIALACKLVKERHGLSNICALPGSWDWSDISYLNDPKALRMANDADLKCIFQFDSEGIRKLVKRGGVTSFNDLPAYSALYRPGPLGMGMDARYCKRKQGDEPYNLHPVLESLLGVTYGVMVYQEQVMDILRVVGGIPDMHTEIVRKAISKKKHEVFGKYKQLFLDNGPKKLECGRTFVEELWEQIESFAEYGFNKSVTIGTEIATVNGIKEIQDFVPGDRVFCVNEQGETVETEVVALHDHGEIEGFEVTFDDGYQITCSANHKFLTENGQISLKEICRSRSYILCDQQYGSVYAKDKRRGMEVHLQSGVSKQKRASQSSDDLQYLQGERTATKVGEVEADLSMWSEDADQGKTCRSSSGVRPLSAVGLEEVGRNACSSLRSGISDLARSGATLEILREVRGDQTREYQTKDGQTQQRQSLARSQEDLLGYSEENLATTRVVGEESREFEEVARGESRSICQMHRSCLEEPQTVKDGNVAQGAIRLEGRTDSLRGRSQTSGFCEGKSLDRSGRILPLLRAQEQLGKSISTSDCSSQRSDVERGVCQAGECDASEIEHGVFPFFDGHDEDRDLGLGAGHAPITDTRRLVSRQIVRVRPVGKCHMFDLEVADPTHNFILPNGVVTSNSHSYAYTYISSRLLWLKAHYPIEFYTAILMCEDDTEKFKQYKLDAKKHDVNIKPVHINKSRENFHIHENDIYFGFSNIKGIGENMAKRIVHHQKYEDFADFLYRFGTDEEISTPSAAIKALTALGCFEESYDRATLRKFADFYKDQARKRRERQKRFDLAMDKKLEELKELLLSEIKEDDPDFEVMSDFTEDAMAKWKERFSEVMRSTEYKSKGQLKQKDVSLCSLLEKLADRRESSRKNFEEKEREAEEEPITLDSFNPSIIELEEKELPLFTDERRLGGEIGYPAAERQYYGFEWIHVLETSPDYTGDTLDRFLMICEEEKRNSGRVEVLIRAVRRRESKKGTEFYSVDIEDANGKNMSVNVWMDDYLRFRDKLVAGNMVKMRVRPPSGGFNTLTFESVPKHMRSKLPPAEDDERCLLMKPAELPKEEEVDLSDLKFSEIAFEEI